MYMNEWVNKTLISEQAVVKKGLWDSAVILKKKKSLEMPYDNEMRMMLDNNQWMFCVLHYWQASQPVWLACVFTVYLRLETVCMGVPCLSCDDNQFV